MLNKTQKILKYIGQDTLNELDIYLTDINNRNYTQFNSEEEINQFFELYNESFSSNMSLDDIEVLRYYTGIAYKDINSLLRGSWDYEFNGVLNDEKEEKLRQLIFKITQIYDKNIELPGDIKTYRGVDIYAFKSFGINSIEELSSLVGNYYYEAGFSSTSLIRDRSFFDKDLEYHNNCDIEIEYKIPQEATDGIPINTDWLSYSKSQIEFLINSGSLSRITNVTISEDKKKAYIQMTLIPKKVWDKGYAEYREMKNNSK